MNLLMYLKMFRLCLCLICCSLLFSCSVIKPQGQTSTSNKSYRLVVVILPGDDASALFALIGNITRKIDIEPFQMRGITGQSELMTLILSIANDKQLNYIQSRLTASGIRFIALSRQFNSLN